jgi:putative PIN family toxin of toxin-antitoxin system
MLGVTADTNILVSGLNFRRGKPFQLLELARIGKITLAVSDAILDEMEDVLRRKFGWNDDDIAEGRKRITAMSRRVRPAVKLDVIRDDPDDNKILECASSAGSGFIVSGDNHLLLLQWYVVRQHEDTESVCFSRLNARAWAVDIGCHGQRLFALFKG